MSTLQIIAVVLFVAIAVGAAIWGRMRIKKGEETADAVQEEAKLPRFPAEDKSFFNGVLLTTYARWRQPDGTWVENELPDIGWTKGSVIGDSIAIVAKHANTAVGIPVYAYDSAGVRHDRTVAEVLTTDRLGAADIRLVRVDRPFPPSVKRWELPDSTPAELSVMHLDGKWTDRTVMGGTMDQDVLTCSFRSKHVSRLIIGGESGLPWRANGKLVSHSFRGWHGEGPNYARLKKDIEDAVAQLSITPND